MILVRPALKRSIIIKKNYLYLLVVLNLDSTSGDKLYAYFNMTDLKCTMRWIFKNYMLQQ